MQLSIVIPIYNFDVKNLVNDLHKQCKLLNIDFEILLVDDFSKATYHVENEKLDSLSNVSYERLKENIGRSKIRNYLLKKAVFENCLVLDCDVEIISSHYIKNYLDAIEEHCVIVGGHLYQEEHPEEISKMLHWKYGTQIECKSLKERLKNPYYSFMTNSFLVQKKTFTKVKFDESIQKYGHEDTVFGIALESQNIAIKHIDNPVLHVGLKTTNDFLKGEKEAILNLIFLSESSKFKDRIIEKSKLLRYEESTLLNWYHAVLLYFDKDWFYKRLFYKNPKLSILHFWKFSILKEFRKTV